MTHSTYTLRHGLAVCVLCLAPGWAAAADALNILRFAPAGGVVDRTGHEDASAALAGAIRAANVFTARGEPACVYIPPGVYRIVTAPPAFVRAGCVKGDGPTQSTLRIDPAFEGDLFAWSEAWAATTPGPTVVGLKVVGDRAAARPQNALVFYDRNDNVFIDNVEVDGVPGRAFYSGIKKTVSQAYMRESHLRSLRFFNDGSVRAPVMEFSSEGTGKTDATNEIELSQVDIYGAKGPSLVIRNSGSGSVRDVSIDELRIEGLSSGETQGDLLTIGDPMMLGNVNNIRLDNVSLIDPARGFSALLITSPTKSSEPYQITFQGSIGGGRSLGRGLDIVNGRTSTFRFSGMHTLDTNIEFGRTVRGMVIDGGGQERKWSYKSSGNLVGQASFPKFTVPSVQP